jgi:hypothetical protein
MQKFLYLRIIAITTAAIILALMIYIFVIFKNFFDHSNTLKTICLGEGSMAAFLGHSILTLFIYYKYYPHTEVSRVAKVTAIILSILCWLNIAFILLFVLQMAVVIMNNNSAKSDQVLVCITLFLIGILYFVQLLGSRRLLKTIQRNARLQLENSFA